MHARWDGGGGGGGGLENRRGCFQVFPAVRSCRLRLERMAPGKFAHPQVRDVLGLRVSGLGSRLHLHSSRGFFCAFDEVWRVGLLAAGGWRSWTRSHAKDIRPESCGVRVVRISAGELRCLHVKKAESDQSESFPSPTSLAF